MSRKPPQRHTRPATRTPNRSRPGLTQRLAAIKRLFGDVNGDGTVDSGTDFARFSNTFGLSSGNPRFDASFDFDDNHTIDSATDFTQFSNRFGKSV